MADGPSLLSVVIPIHNERENLIPLTEQLLTILPKSEQPFEIIFVDDGSTDGSSEILDRLDTTYDSVFVVHLLQRYGQTAAFDAGFKRATGDRIVTMDGDLQYDPNDILQLLPLSRDYDLVCGRRKTRNDHFVRAVSSRIAYAVRNAVTGDHVRDTGCSLKIFSRRLVERFPLFDGMHRFFPALARMYGYTVTEHEVRHMPRVHGQSKYGIHNRLWRGLLDLCAVWWMQRRCLTYRYRPSRMTDEREPR